MNESSAVGNIMDVTESNLQEVLQLSTEKLVLLFIGMGSDEASNQQLRLVEQLANGYDGKMVLAKLDAERQQMVAQQLISQLRANAIPVHAFLHEGRPVQVLNGPQTEQALRGVIDPLTMSPAEQIKLQVDALIEAGMIEQALELLQKILQEEPDNHGLQVLQVNLLLELGRMDDARQLLAALPADAPGIAQPKAKLAFYEMVAEAPQRDALEARLQEDENDHEARYQLAIRLVIADDIESALDNLLVIVRRDRAFREDGARLLMLKVFEQLGAGNAVAKRYRGKLFGLMH
ncbi:tetratricopeptide repeat protein [Endozoicomonas euniceicola]|uniref:Tetratricopeptide repeat protein n=1 Tax=Endozoicomonas euniceicola TaxID=1234143 RepID=A0ABY6GXI4_9GAMM|nr:tetratricopeptide repeat protein [Endozoicomonas euniceicola]UYM16766.1 tetratricopeptide repeat protein [Endozoicomonas euniceicola]